MLLWGGGRSLKETTGEGDICNQGQLSWEQKKKRLLNATTHWRESKDKQSPTHTGMASAHRSVLKEM